MTIAIEEHPLQSESADPLYLAALSAVIPQQSRGMQEIPITTADVAPFVEPGLDNNDLRLLARLADIARRGGSSTLMRCLGIAARTPAEIPDTLARFSRESPPDAFAVESLEAALTVRNSGIEQRARPSTQSRRELMALPRYQELLDANRRHPADRTVQYYALGKIAGMIASAKAGSPVQ